jgi:hypothetical protein
MGMPNIAFRADFKTAKCLFCKEEVETKFVFPMKVADLDQFIETNLKPWADKHALCHLNREENGKNGRPEN